MDSTKRGAILLCALLAGAPACGEAAPSKPVRPVANRASPSDGPNPPEGSPEGQGGDTGREAQVGVDGGSAADGASLRVGTELRLVVRSDTPTFVRLAEASEAAAHDVAAAGDWDLKLQGWDIFTNGGVSGAGKGGAFGPLPFTYLLAAEDPTDAPFLIEDKAAGAFRDWYAYDGKSHALYSRFHVYGVKSGARYFKLQLLGYYGEVQGAPISGLYQARYAEVTAAGVGPLQRVQSLDATAGGLGGDAERPSACLSLASGVTQSLTPPQQLASASWDLCFRRDAVTVNGDWGGPGGVAAVDLASRATKDETLDVVRQRTAQSEAAAFDAVDYAALTAAEAEYRGDRIISAFTDAWIDAEHTPPTLTESAWLVVGADGVSRFLVGFTKQEGSSRSAVGMLTMRIVKVR